MANKYNDIAEVQEKLRTLSFDNKAFPEIAIDGIFGTETKEAVRMFQRQYDLNETGAVDFDTWNALDNQYLQILKKHAEPYSITPFSSCKFELKRGDRGDVIYILQVMIGAIARKYKNIPTPSINGIFDEQTEAALSTLQSANGLPPDGRLNKQSWNAIAALYNNNYERMC